MFKELDPILHSQLRLAVMSLLISVREAEFNFIKEKTNATAGNLSVQLNKLKDAGYIEITKQFKDNYPLTTCRISPKGIDAFDQYVKDLQQYLVGRTLDASPQRPGEASSSRTSVEIEAQL